MNENWAFGLFTIWARKLFCVIITYIHVENVSVHVGKLNTIQWGESKQKSSQNHNFLAADTGITVTTVIIQIITIAITNMVGKKWLFKHLHSQNTGCPFIGLCFMEQLLPGFLVVLRGLELCWGGGKRRGWWTSVSQPAKEETNL